MSHRLQVRAGTRAKFKALRDLARRHAVDVTLDRECLGLTALFTPRGLEELCRGGYAMRPEGGYGRHPR